MSTYSNIYDRQRGDERINVLANPFWISSEEVSYATALAHSSAALILFTFPAAKGKSFRIRDIAIQVTSAWAGMASGSLIVGPGTIPTTTITDGTTDITYTASSAWLTVSAASAAIAVGVTYKNMASVGVVATVTPADSSMPVVYFKQSATPSKGKAMAHILVDRLPAI